MSGGETIGAVLYPIYLTITIIVGILVAVSIILILNWLLKNYKKNKKEMK